MKKFAIKFNGNMISYKNILTEVQTFKLKKIKYKYKNKVLLKVWLSSYECGQGREFLPKGKHKGLRGLFTKFFHFNNVMFILIWNSIKISCYIHSFDKATLRLIIIFEI